MPNYNDAQGVADLLSQFDFNIISEGPGDFSTQHRKYTCEFSKPGIESFTTTYQCNPRFGGQPTATDVFAALASDALAVDGRHIDDFADERPLERRRLYGFQRRDRAHASGSGSRERPLCIEWVR